MTQKALFILNYKLNSEWWEPNTNIIDYYTDARPKNIKGGDFGDAYGLCNISENRLPVKEFIEDFNKTDYIAKTPKKSAQVAQRTETNNNDKPPLQDLAAEGNINSQIKQVLSLFKRYELIEKSDWKNIETGYKAKTYFRHENYKVWDYENTECRIAFEEQLEYNYWGNKLVMSKDKDYCYKAITLEVAWMPPTFKGAVYKDKIGDAYYKWDGFGFTPAAEKAYLDWETYGGNCAWTENRWPVKEFLQDLDDRIVIKR